MLSKFVLIVALCCAQGLAFRPRDQAPGKKPPCKNSGFEFEKEIPHDFEDAMQEMDEVRETVSTAMFDAYFKGNDPEVVVACFRQQKGNFTKLGRNIYGMMNDARKEMKELLKENYGKYEERIEVPLRAIGKTMKEYPVKVWLLIKEKEFNKALEAMRESRRIIEENSKILGGIVREMAEEFPECAERAEELAQNIRLEARKGCKAIGQEFRKCVEQGGPKMPIEESEVDAEIDAEVDAEIESQIDAEVDANTEVEDAPEQ